MKRPEIKHETYDIPRLSEGIKRKNGKSHFRLNKCIESLQEVLEDEHEVEDDESEE